MRLDDGSAKHVLVDSNGTSIRVVPAEQSGARNPASGQFLVRGTDMKLLDCPANLVGIPAVEQQGRVAGDLGNRRTPDCDYRASGAHRFQNRYAEALVQRHVCQAQRPVVLEIERRIVQMPGGAISSAE